ncbi:MAG: ATP synthase F0 subunit C [Planctomycetota bacterium]|nr:ATP synthase F0 subunit C [Planctomycetota bacterium]MCX8039787.1 ATP synthase F0 subunit C [Planctomycetota bacterium]MDW8373167.1 ATP synthase F0 subunit C [Planctomycetota bacterium]
MLDLLPALQAIASTVSAAASDPASNNVALDVAKEHVRGLNHLGAGLALGFGALGGGIGIGLVGAATVMGITRQPEQAGTLRGLMFVVAALIEGLALIAMVIGMVLAFS